MTKVEIETFDSVAPLVRSFAEEAAARTALLECAGTFSPRVEDRCDGSAFLCVIDIAGTEKLFGPPAVLAQSLLRRVRALGVMACVAVSSNFHAAICNARGRPTQTAVIPAGVEGIALAPLPVDVLDLREDHAEIFSLWGIRTLGALAALPEKELVARLGQEGKRLRQLARGELPHLFVPMEPMFRLEERMELDAPVELLESLLFVVGVMLEQLILRASARTGVLALGYGDGRVDALEEATACMCVRCGLRCRAVIGRCGSSCFILTWRRIRHRLRRWFGLTLTAEPGSRPARCSLGCSRRSFRSRCGWM